MLVSEATVSLDGRAKAREEGRAERLLDCIGIRGNGFANVGLGSDLPWAYV